MSDVGPVPILDAGALARLAKLGALAGRDMIGELVGLFVRDVPPQIAACRDALAHADADALRRAAHAARGDASALGALELAELCARIETGAAAEDPAALQELVDGLEPAFSRARTMLEDGDGGGTPF